MNEHLLSELATGEGRTTRLTYRHTFLVLAELGVCGKEFAERISRSAGLRNLLVHDYNGAEGRIVHASIRSCLADYAEYVGAVRGFLDRLAPQGPEERNAGTGGRG